MSATWILIIVLSGYISSSPGGDVSGMGHSLVEIRQEFTTVERCEDARKKIVSNVRSLVVTQGCYIK